MELSSLANGWVESYLDALLSAGLSSEHSGRVGDQDRAELVANAEQQICAKYYVQQILGLDEDGIKQAWMKANRSSATRLSSEKDARLEYLSWRVWGMRRKKEAVLIDNQLAARAEDDANDSNSDTKSDIAEDVEQLRVTISTVPDVAPVQDSKPHLRLQFSTVSESSLDESTSTPDLTGSIMDEMEPVAMDSLSPTNGQKHYIVMISLHGLVRGERMELGKDPDTGGQVKYVVELAKAMAQQPSVYRVDLLTRLITDPKVDASYGQPEECLLKGEEELSGAYIVRLPCGPPNQYLRKEALWPHVREFADRGIEHVKSMLTSLSEVSGPCQLLAVHGHYADAGEAAALMSHTLAVDMLLTGHSLGRNKLDHLLKSGNLSRAEIESTYAISRRIEAEERAVDGAIIVFTSTQQEVTDQWGLYNGCNASLEAAMHLCPRRGRRFPLMVVIPPGLDFSNLKVDLPNDPFTSLPAFGRPPTSSPVSQRTGTSPGNSPRSFSQVAPIAAMEDPPIWQEIFRFLRNPRKPVILAMSRPDAKKNITTLVKAFANSKPLRELANLVLIMGNRNDIDSMASGSQKVLEQVLKLIDAYNLYGSVAYPKHHSQKDISDIYLLPAATRGVFVNIALQEPFGLTLIEAAAHGVPVVATKNGGPVDIIGTLGNGILVEPTNAEAVASALLNIVTEPETWDEYSMKGRANIMAYSWPSHCSRYLQQLQVEHHKSAGVKRFASTYSASFASPLMQQVFSDAVENFAASSPDFSSLAANPTTAHSLAALDIDRFSSLPPLPIGASSTSHHHFLSPLPSGAQYGGATDDLVLLPLAPSSEVIPSLLPSRDRYIVLAVDSLACAKQLSNILQTQASELGFTDSGAKKVGLGVASVLGYRATCSVLSEAGLKLPQIAFIITGCGSEIWYPGSDGKPREDSQYEEHIDNCWDRIGLKRTVVHLLRTNAQLLTNKQAATTALKHLGSDQRLLSGRTTSMDLAAANLTMAQSLEIPGSNFRLRRDVGHYHLEIEIPNTSQQILPKLAGTIRKRLRSSGMRTNLTVRSHSGGSAGPVSLHLTPLRASRALALRYLAHKHDLSMGQFTVVAAGMMDGGGQEVRMVCSDGEDVLGGMQPVVVVDMKVDAPVTFPVPMEGLVGRVSLMEGSDV